MGKTYKHMDYKNAKKRRRIDKRRVETITSKREYINSVSIQNHRDQSRE